MRRWLLPLLAVVNVPVWLGQVWPEGAPPFARGVNVVFLSATLAFFAVEAVRAWLVRFTSSMRQLGRAHV